MATVAGALMLPGGSAFAACAPLTAGPDATLCTGNLDNSNSDALAGNDTITFTAGTNVGNDAGATVSGGLDNDSIVLSNSAIGKGARSEGLVLGDVGADTITINNSYVGGSGAGTVGGGDGNDSISLSNGRIGQNLQSTGQVMGDAGADTIMLDKTYLGDSGDGTVSGGLDSDFIALSNSIIGRNGRSTGQVLGDAGADTITLNQSVVGFQGAGTVSGGADNDSIALSYSIIGRNGRSTGQVLGDAGADTITLNQSVVGFQGAGTVSGGDGNDSIALSNKSAIGFLAGSTGQVLGDAGNDTVTINNSVVGGAGAATVDGGADNDSIALTNGASIGPRGKVLGSAGNDTVSIDDSITRSGGSVIDGGADTDLLSFTAKGNATVTPRAFLNFERLQKLGAGTLTLSGSQTWSESTTVSAGTLNVAGVLTSVSTVVEPGATLATRSGRFVGSVFNQGTVSPGGAGRVETTSVTGTLTQTGTGILAVDVDMGAGRADRVNVNGPASLAGFVQPTVDKIQQRSQGFTILSAAGGTINQGIKLTAKDTAVIDYQLLFPNPNDMVLAILVDFSASGLNRNQTAIGDHFNWHLDQGGTSSLQPVVDALLDLPDLPSLANAHNQLSPEIYLDTEIAALYSNRDFTNSMMSCPVREGADAFIREDECVWARVKGRRFDQDTAFETLGFDETTFQVSGGAQFALGEAWRLGAALGYERSNLETDTNAEADGDRLNGGVVLKYNPGALLLAAAASGGWGWYDTERPIAFPGFSAVSSSDNEIGVINGRLRAAYLFSSGAWYAKPMVDLDATYLDLSNTRERGAGGASLIINGNDETVLSASPALELGTQFQWSNGTLIRPYVRGGATFFDNTEFALEASFEGSADGVGPFRIRSNTDDVVANLSTGVDLIASGGARVKMFYDGSFGDDVEEHSGGIKVSLPLQPSQKVRAALK